MLGAVAVVGAGAVAVAVIQRDGDDEGPGDELPAWDAIAVIDGRGDGLVILDDDGEERSRMSTGVDGATSAFSRAGYLAFVGDDRVAIVDVGSDEVRAVDVPEGSLVVPAPQTQEFALIAVPPVGGDGLVITPDDEFALREISGLDDALFLPTSVQVTPDARYVITADARSFQTVVIPTDGGDPTFAPGLAVGIVGDDLVTAQTAGPETEIAVRPIGGGDDADERTFTVPTARGVLLAPDGRLVVVSDDGSVTTTTTTAADPDDGEDIDLAGEEIDRVVPFPAGERMVVVSGTRIVVVDSDGVTVGAVDGSLTSTPLSAATPRCVPITTGEGALTFLDLETAELLGEPVEDVGQVAAAMSADGCTATFLGAGGPATSVWQDGERLDLGDVERVLAIAPDGSAAIVASGEDVMLRSLTDLDDEGTELGALDANRYAFVED